MIAQNLGFTTVGFAPAGRTRDGARFEAWIDAGRHADMEWIVPTTAVRLDPRTRLTDARSVVVLGIGHGWKPPPDPGGRTGRVARYAWGRDYHNLVGKRLKKLTRALRSEGIQCFGGVDTAPVIERSWAVEAGVGVLGKNAMVFQPGKTSWLFLAAIVVDAYCTPDVPIEKNHCGSCSRCLRSCPTNAFVGAYELDARRCISYWTIEAKELAPTTMLPNFGRWVLGCDACQSVCPHNHHPPPPTEVDFLPKNAWLDLDELLSTPDDKLMERFIGTPLRRPGAAGLKRNAAVAIGNIGDTGGLDVLNDYGLRHDNLAVQKAARWAISRLLH